MTTDDPAAALTLSPEVQAELRAHLPSVAERAVEAIVAEVPDYAAARAFMVSTIHQAVQLALGGFLTIAARADDASTPLGPARNASYELGRGEARSGRTLDALLAAYRIGARVSWRELSEVAVRAGMSAPLLAKFAELVFAYIDELSAASAAGHADELATAERLHRAQLDRLGTELLRGGSEDELAHRAERAGWEPPVTLTVVLIASAALHDVRGRFDQRTLRLDEDLPDATGQESLAALLVPDLGPAARTRLLRTLARQRPDPVGTVVVGPPRPWLQASASYRRALRAARLLAGAEAGPAAYDTEANLADLVVSADPEALHDLRSRALAPLDDLSPAARDKLLETLRLWLLHGRRREPVAAELFVHPQTVRYRVGQLRELFGERLDDADAVRDLVIALQPPPQSG